MKKLVMLLAVALMGTVAEAQTTIINNTTEPMRVYLIALDGPACTTVVDVYTVPPTTTIGPVFPSSGTQPYADAEFVSMITCTFPGGFGGQVTTPWGVNTYSLYPCLGGTGTPGPVTGLSCSGPRTVNYSGTPFSSTLIIN